MNEYELQNSMISSGLNFPISPDVCTGQWTGGDVMYLNHYSAPLSMSISYPLSNFNIPDNPLFMKVEKQNEQNHLDSSMAVNFWDLDENLRVQLSPRFCLLLFDSCGIGLKQLSYELGCSYSYVCHLRRNYYSIPISYIKFLSSCSGIPLSDIQDQVSVIQSRAGKSIDVAFPIASSIKLASLVGHVFGDGYIGRKKSQFEYCNDNQRLLDQVESDIYQLFGLNPFTKRKNRIGYPVILGKILVRFGAPYAPKILSDDPIPQWIMDNPNYARAFLQAIYDDDGSAMYAKNYRAKGINLHIIRHQRHEKATIRLLSDIGSMLRYFNVRSGQPKIIRRYSKSDGERIVAYINITDIRSIENFDSKIRFTRGNKNDTLKRILSLGIRSRIK